MNPRGWRVLGLLVAVAVSAWGPERIEAQTRKSLAESAEEWMEAFRAQDPVAIASHMAEDGIAHFPGWDVPVIGREANEKAWVSYFTRRPHHPLSTERVVTAASDDLGYTVGQALYTEATDPEAYGGRYVAVWRRIDGEWKVVMLAAHRHSDVTSETFQRGESRGSSPGGRDRDFR